jgi:limonene-1,2-epoxide hydrolase
MQTNVHDINPKEVVTGFLEALNHKDFKSARNYVSDNVTYMSPVNTLNGAEAYFKYVEHLNLPKLDIKMAFAEGSHDVCVLWDINYGTSPAPIFVSAWYQVQDGKISSMRLIFDPRPLLQQPK